MKEIIARRLREARDSRGLTRSEAAQKTGINYKTLAGYENAVSEPDLDTFVILGQAYGVLPEWLAGLSDNPYPLDNTEKNLPALDSWRQAKDFPTALLAIKDIQKAYSLSPGDAIDMIKEAAAEYKWEIPDIDPRQKAAHTSGPASIGGSGIFGKKRHDNK